MKTITLFLTLLISAFAMGQTPILTMISDGDCSGGNPKVVEIYADGAVDFANYSLEIQTNANTTWGNTLNLGDLGTVTDDFVYIHKADASFATEYPSATNTLSTTTSAVNFNGDDRIRIVEDATSSVIDQYGAESTDGTGEVWEYQDGYAKRNNGSGPDSGFFAGNWSYYIGDLDGKGTCQGEASFESIIGIGSYSPTGGSNDPQLSVSPNSIANLNYTVNDGPSQEESFTLEGQFLTDDILVTAPPSYEVSLSSGSGFASSVNVSPSSSGSVSSTTVYVRLAAGLAENTYTEDVEVSTTGATTQNVTLEGTVFGEVTSDMLISGVFDGPLTGGTPKVIELYVINNIADLSAYGFGSANNGGGSEGEEFTFPNVAATAGDYIYIATESANFNTYFGFNPDYEDGAAGINGDDAIELFQNGQVIDTFGDINTDGTGEDWDYLDGWAYRNDNTGPDGSNFTISNWTFSGVDVNDNQTDNSSATTPFPIGSFETTMDVNSFSAANLKLYPNPVSNGVLSIETQSSATAEVEFFNMLGQKVLAAKASKHINVSSLTAGIYLVRVQEGASSQTKKIVIK